MSKSVGLWCCVAVAALACKRPAAAAPPDAGPLVLEATLGGPLSAVKGSRWPISGKDKKPLSMHAVDARSHVTVHFPSGRTYDADTDSVTYTLDEAAGTLRGVALWTKTDMPWPEATAKALELARRVGVDEKYVTPWVERLRVEKSGTFYPSFPVEGCILAQTTLLARHGKWTLSLELNVTTPQIWKNAGTWPDTCR